MTPWLVAVLGLVLVTTLAVGSGAMVLLAAARRRKVLNRRLRRIANPSGGNVLMAEQAPEDKAEETVIVRRAGRQRHLWRRLEAVCPLISVPAVAPLALAIGLLGGAAVVGALWFVRVPWGWWTVPALAAGAGGAFLYAFSWFQQRALTQFVAKFPETMDQIVRLSATGVPVVEAIASVASHSPHPVKPVLSTFSDQLGAGIDPNDAAKAVSERYRIPELTMFTAVIRLQRRSGGAISSSFTNLANTLRERRRSALKAKAATAQTRFTLLILAVLPGILLLAQRYTSPASVEVLFHTDAGMQLLRWGFALVVLGIVGARAVASRAVR